MNPPSRCLRAGPFVVALMAMTALQAAVALAFAADPFEIQVYDGTSNRAGVPGVELHLNDWTTGHRDATAPERPLHGQFHATLEPSYGVAPFWELGAYFQMALRTDDGAVDWAGAKLRSKFVTPPQWDRHWRLGVNLEVSLLPETYDRDRWGSEIRPILAWTGHGWLLAFNPILGQSLAGAGASDGPSFEPAAKVAKTVGPVALGLEYYSSLGPLAAPLPWRQEQHYVYETIDVLAIASFELNVGVGEGLTQASAGVIVKAIVGYTFELVRPEYARERSKIDGAPATELPGGTSNEEMWHR
jgi:hypothetical protein